MVRDADVDGLFEVRDVPPHPKENSETNNAKPSKLIPTMLFRAHDFRLRVVISVPNSPKPGMRATMLSRP